MRESKRAGECGRKNLALKLRMTYDPFVNIFVVVVVWWPSSALEIVELHRMVVSRRKKRVSECAIYKKSGILISKKCMKNTLTIDKVHQPSFQRILPYLTFTIIIVVIIIINNEVYLCTNARNKWKKATRENQFSGYIRFHNEKLINGIAPIIETIRNCLFWENK